VTRTPEEALEQAALAGVHRLPIPTPFAVGKVNAYLIEDDPLTLIDSGPNYGRGLDVLAESMAAHGHAIEDIGLVLITHNHTDHILFETLLLGLGLGVKRGLLRHRLFVKLVRFGLGFSSLLCQFYSVGRNTP